MEFLESSLESKTAKMTENEEVKKIQNLRKIHKKKRQMKLKTRETKLKFKQKTMKTFV